MQQMTFNESVKRAWASAWDAATQMPHLTLGAFIAYAALSCVAFAGRPVPGAGETPSGALVFAANLATLLTWIVDLGFIIKIHRFVLLREGTTPLLPLGGKPLARTFVLGIVITLGLIASALLLYAILRPRYESGSALFGAIVSVVWIFIAVRVSLLFPAISTGSRIDLRGAWHDSRGHFWNLFGVPFVALLPLIGCALVALIIIGAAGITPAAIASPTWLVLLATGQAAANIAFTLISSASLAWLYRRYASRLPVPPEA
ncbi:hypothetical protein [Paraburkholderia sp.]|uniref:hypothetical protein n=1 Tax=Paraburkholderia sp. TaxID=1926495 RepID=UPI0025E94CBF|nr:hypothetical protein [Paraburkholderia sp.]